MKETYVIQKKVIELKFGEEVETLTRATHLEVEEYLDKLNENPDDYKKAKEIAKQHLLSHGMSESLYKQLANDDLMNIIGLVNGKPKN